MKTTARAALLAALLAFAALPDLRAEGDDRLRAGPEVEVRGAKLRLHLWRLPDGSELELVRVAAGGVTIGEGKRALSVSVEPFLLARTETTRAAFHAFRAATRQASTAPAAGEARLPVADVTWGEAKAFCDWAGLALPTEAEWQLAAGDQAFPWGAEAGAGNGNFCDRTCPEPFEWKELDQDDGFGRAAPVGSFPAGVAACGALDLGGNVWEWCQDDAGDGARAARGGGWCSPRETGRTAFRHAFSPDTRWAGLGFRAVLRR